MHKALARGKTDTVLAIKRSDGTYTFSAEERATALLLAHFLETIRENQCQPVVEQKPSRLYWIVTRYLFTAESIKWTMTSFAKCKSPGAEASF